MRLIDADELMQVFSKRQPDYYSTCYIASEIAAAPTIATDINVPGKWISTDDRLPSDKNLVYVWFRQGSKWKSPIPFVGRYDPVGYGGWRIYGVDDDLLDIFKVTHWMPLPELPEDT